MARSLLEAFFAKHADEFDALHDVAARLAMGRTIALERAGYSRDEAITLTIPYVASVEGVIESLGAQWPVTLSTSPAASASTSSKSSAKKPHESPPLTLA